MEKPKFDLQITKASVDDEGLIEEIEKAIKTAKLLGYQKIDFKFKAYEMKVAEKVAEEVPNGQLSIFD